MILDEIVEDKKIRLAEQKKKIHSKRCAGWEKGRKPERKTAFIMH